MDRDPRAYGIAIRFRPDKLDGQPVPFRVHFVFQESMAVRRGGDGYIKKAAIPKIGYGDSPAIQQQIRAAGAPDFSEGAIPVVSQVPVALIAVPGVIPVLYSS